MKGIIFSLFEQFITETFGDETYEEILTACPLKTKEPFIGPGSYPDEDLFSLVSRAVEISGMALPDALRAFGRFCVPKLADKFPDLVKPYSSPKELLMKVDSIIHVEVKKLYKDAETPEFIYEDPAPDRLIMQYKSGRKLCYFMEGLIDGVADVFRSPITHRQRHCMLEGGELCEFELTFEPERVSVP